MMKFDSTTYTIADIIEWNKDGILDLSPEFQRRIVWTNRDRSYLIDTILEGKPIPKIFVRKQQEGSRRIVREIVDGQQRLEAIIGFVDGNYSISKTHSETYGGLTFAELPEDVRDDFLQYEVTADELIGASDIDVLDIFQRLNSKSYTLIRPEILNAKFKGDFKDSALTLAQQYVTFWHKHKIISYTLLTRMKEVELTADILIAMADGIHGLKEMEIFYEKWDGKFPHRSKIEKAFHETMSLIDEIFEDELAETEFKRPIMFYTLAISIFSVVYQVGGVRKKRKIKEGDFAKLRNVFLDLDKVIKQFKQDPKADFTSAQKAFLNATKGATSEPKQRNARDEYIARLISKKIGS